MSKAQPRNSPFLFLVLALAAAACTRGSENTYSPGEAPLANLDLPRELEIMRSDPSVWTVKVSKTGPEATDWIIAGQSAGTDLLDRRAHGRLIEHLLDTLKGLQITEKAPNGPIESFGLLPPVFALRWSKGGELRIGSSDKDPYERFAQFLKPGQTYRDATVYRVRGAALKMLEYMESLASMRQQTLTSPLAADDVDELEILKKGRIVAYAQREGSVWTDRKHKPIQRGITPFLETVTHARIREFVDEPKTADELSKRVRSKPLFTAVMKDRRGNPSRLDLAWAVDVRRGEEHLFAAVSGRPGAFQVYRELLSALESLGSW